MAAKKIAAAKKAAAESKGGLSEKRQRFVDEYIIDLNATQAAIRSGYSQKTAYSQGQRLLKDVEVQAAIAESQGKRGERTQITADRVLQELGRIGLSDLRGAFTPGGALLPPEQWPNDLAPAISGVEVVTRPSGEFDKDGNPLVERIHKLRLWDKNTALANIAKHFGMFIERHEHTGKDGGPLQVERIERVIKRPANRDG